MRKLIASAFASAPSSDGPVDAPVSTPTLNGLPGGVFCFGAFCAIASGIAFGAPAGVKPLKPIVWPCLDELGRLFRRQVVK